MLDELAPVRAGIRHPDPMPVSAGTQRDDAERLAAQQRTVQRTEPAGPLGYAARLA